MNQFDFSSTLALGQYEPSDSAVHQLVPAVKLLAVILLGSTVLFSPLFPQLPVLFFFFCLVVWKGGLKVRRLMKAVRPVLPFLVLIGIIQIFFIPRETAADPLWSYRFLRIYGVDLYETAQLFARFFCLVLLLSLFSAVTPFTELSYGTEALLKPLGKKNGLAHDMSLVITITFRFIPILVQEAEGITKAQASRGGAFGTSKTGFFRKIRLYIPLIVPLFVAALERSEVLVEAMESRCYEPGQPRTRLDEFHWKKSDRITLSGVVFLFCLLLASRILDLPRFGGLPF